MSIRLTPETTGGIQGSKQILVKRLAIHKSLEPHHLLMSSFKPKPDKNLLNSSQVSIESTEPEVESSNQLTADRAQVQLYELQALRLSAFCKVVSFNVKSKFAYVFSEAYSTSLGDLYRTKRAEDTEFSEDQLT